MSARGLLMQVAGRHIHVRAEGDRLRYSAPKGALTSDLRESLVRQKPGIVKLLSRADGFLEMTLRQFEGRHCCLEVQVPGLGETIWFVSGRAEVDTLRSEGVRRGRIWTARELRDLVTAPGMTHEGALSIARARLAFNAEIVDVQPADPEACPSAVAEAPRIADAVQASLDLDAPARGDHDR